MAAPQVFENEILVISTICQKGNCANILYSLSYSSEYSLICGLLKSTECVTVYSLKGIVFDIISTGGEWFANKNK